jgi:hypothetical protein
LPLFLESAMPRTCTVSTAEFALEPVSVTRFPRVNALLPELVNALHV